MKSKNKNRSGPTRSVEDRSRNSEAAPTKAVRTSQRWQAVFIVGVLCALGIILVLALVLPGYDENNDPVVLATRVAQARQLLENKRYPEAEQLASSIPAKSPLFEESRLLAGEAATRHGRLQAALEYYDTISSGTSSDALLAAYATGEIYRAQCLIAPAIKAYQQVLEHDPDNSPAHERIAFLLGVTRQHWLAAQHHLDIVRLRTWTLDSLAILADIERSIEQPGYIAQCVQKAPDEPLTMLAQAAEYLYDGKPELAQPLLEKAIAKEPSLFTAQALLGELLLKGEPAQLTKWNAQLPKGAVRYPDIWYVRGLQARNAQQFPIAAGCFAKAVRLAPEHRRATYQLGQLLTQLGHQAAGPFVQRAKLQADFGLLLDQILATRGQNEASIQKACEISEQLGRVWEAWAWAQTGESLFPTAAWPLPIVRRLTPQLSPSLPRTLLQANLATDVDLNGFVLSAEAFPWNGQSSDSQSTTELAANNNNNRPQKPASNLRFQLEENVGIDFVYNNGPDPQTPGMRMFEQTGGGVGVIDYDNDGWPDLYFTQGTPWKTGDTHPSPAPEFYDTLYRNRDGGRFQDVSKLVRIEELNFSQGVAVGDYDADGFDDIFVGNIGPSTLWHNNGDGTFSETTAQLGPQTNVWTTSVLLADLNGDAICDIFKVNYLKGADVFTAICDGKGCSPKGFEGEVDQVYLGKGDGTFELQDNSGPTVDSKGMGIVAFKLGDKDDLSLFISNDQVANYLLISRKTPEGKLAFDDEALVRGVAFNTDGLPMAGMGIAADDIDNNGLIDMLVTNFANEASTLYMQDSPGLFMDSSTASGMQMASFKYVGWGTQLMDIDWDGDSDLVVVNGHVDDYRSDGGMYQMPPQLFQNIGKGRFSLIQPTDSGNYFAGQYSARGMARLDWNRDGLIDFVVSNIGQSASLVTNATATTHHLLKLNLVGTHSARQPFGARVTMRCASSTFSKQLIGGSGYQASNECDLSFGLADALTVDEVIVDWPSGLKQSFGPVPADHSFRIVEGDSRVDQQPCRRF